MAKISLGDNGAGGHGQFKRICRSWCRRSQITGLGSADLFGAEKAGNKKGTIPEYKGEVVTPPAGYNKSSHDHVSEVRAGQHDQECHQLQGDAKRTEA
jgi:hypothetical protein